MHICAGLFLLASIAVAPALAVIRYPRQTSSTLDATLKPPPLVQDDLAFCPDPKMNWPKTVVTYLQSVFDKDKYDVVAPSESALNDPHPDCAQGFGITFDIDGVLMHQKKPIPGAGASINAVEKLGIPYTVLTNGGGQTEAERVAFLNSVLHTNISVDHFVQSHTPYGEWDDYKNGTILVVGQDPGKARGVFENYGFKTVVTTCDILVAAPGMWAHFPQPEDPIIQRCARELPKPIDPNHPENGLKVDHIFVINDPMLWHWDAQVIMDLLVSSGGVLGTISSKNGNSNLPNHGWGMDGQPRVYFSADDLEYSNGWPVPRFGTGAFTRAFMGLWAEKTNSAELNYMIGGKPTHFQYAFVEEREVALSKAMNGGKHCPLRTNYMIGDNPLTDIAGAMKYVSNHGTKWFSILVETGVFQHGDTPVFKPTTIQENVVEAVKWIAQKEGKLDAFNEAIAEMTSKNESDG